MEVTNTAVLMTISSLQRWALLRNMVTDLIKHERIQTTVPKAKEARTCPAMYRLACLQTALGLWPALPAGLQAAGRRPCFRRAGWSA